MATFNLTKKTISYKDKLSSTGQKVTFLGGGNTNNIIEINNLKNRITKQEQKLDKIIELLQNGNNLPNTNKQSS